MIDLSLTPRTFVLIYALSFWVAGFGLWPLFDPGHWPIWEPFVLIDWVVHLIGLVLVLVLTFTWQHEGPRIRLARAYEDEEGWALSIPPLGPDGYVTSRRIGRSRWYLQTGVWGSRQRRWAG